MQRYFIELSYLGTHYYGWQIQPNHPSIQEEIEKPLRKIYQNKELMLTGCGRTDTGVHASEYFAHFEADERFELEELRHKLNTMLKPDIAIHRIFKVKSDLHARFSATKRSYEYRINRHKNPFNQFTSWHLNRDLDIALMNKASKICLGKNDFECFSKVHTEVNNFICEIYAISWIESGDYYLFNITGNRFLRNMVRAMVGTFIEVGEGKLSLSDFEKIIRSKNRSNAGASVPAKGLTLTRVLYENDF